MPETVNRMRAPNPVSALLAAVTSPPGRAVFRCLTACALQALQAYGNACDSVRRD